MKFVTKDEAVELWFKTPGRFGPADEVWAYACEIEALVIKRYQKEVAETLKWVDKAKK
jgi:hypothetical protein